MCVYTVLLCSTQHRYNARLPNSLPLLHYSLLHYTITVLCGGLPICTLTKALPRDTAVHKTLPLHLTCHNNSRLSCTFTIQYHTALHHHHIARHCTTPHLDLSQQSETQLHLHHRTPHLTTPFPSYSALDKTVLYLHHTSYYYTIP